VSGSRADGGRLRGDGGGGSSDEDSASRQNVDLRQRLHEEASIYRRRLDTYRQAQQDQAALVSRLQAKVLQYKQRCADLEAQMLDYPKPFDQPSSLKPSSLHLPTSPQGTALEQAQQHLRELREERITDLDTALRRLDEEKRRNEKLMQLNVTLREQLEESHNTNESLTGDLQKLTNDWEALREEMIIKEDEWKDEEQAFNDYYSTEHNRLLNLWRDVVSVKRLFMDIQSTTERDLNSLKSEVNSLGKEMMTACCRMDTNIFTDTVLGVRKSDRAKNLVIDLCFLQGKERYLHQQELSDLKHELDTMKIQHDTCQTEIKMKEERIQQLVKDAQTLVSSSLRRVSY
jgi:rootletin